MACAGGSKADAGGKQLGFFFWEVVGAEEPRLLEGSVGDSAAREMTATMFAAHLFLARGEALAGVRPEVDCAWGHVDNGVGWMRLRELGTTPLASLLMASTYPLWVLTGAGAGEDALDRALSGGRLWRPSAAHGDELAGFADKLRRQSLAPRK